MRLHPVQPTTQEDSSTSVSKLNRAGFGWFIHAGNGGVSCEVGIALNAPIVFAAFSSNHRICAIGQRSTHEEY